MTDYEVFYNNIYNWFMKPATNRLKILKFIYKFIPYLTMLIYVFLLLYVFVLLKEPYKLLKIIMVPFTAFVAVSLIRKLFNRPRPYTRFNIKPLIAKEKSGESFPSRHTLSITIIAMAALYINVYLGIFLWIIAVVLAASRVLAGVHFISDVVSAAVISIIWGIIGLYIL